MNHYAATSTEDLTITFSALPQASTPIQGVDLWLLDLTKIAETDGEKFAAQLVQSDIERAQQFKKNQHHFLATRALLRSVFAHYTGIPARKLMFDRTTDGKPFLINPFLTDCLSTNNPQPLYFNLTHSGNFAALAVTQRGEVGLDIESPRKRSYVNIVERYFHADEVQLLRDCAEAEREKLFYQLWTLKEAFFKALGTGISTGLDKASFSFHDASINASFSPDLNQHTAHWQFYQEFISPKVVVALAVASQTPIQTQWFDGNAMLSG